MEMALGALRLSDSKGVAGGGGFYFWQVWVWNAGLDSHLS